MSSVPISNTPFSSFKYPRPAPSAPTTGSPMRPETPPLRRMFSEPFISRTHTPRGQACQLTYDHFTAMHPQCPIRRGYVGVQREHLRSWSWTRRLWLVLEDKWLHICQKEDSPASDTIVLNAVRSLERIETKRFCIMIATSSQVWYLLFKDTVSLHDWLYDIRVRCPLLRIGGPTDFRHELHVTYDPDAKEITGLPQPWIETLSAWGIGPCFNGSPESPAVVSPTTETAFSPMQSDDTHPSQDTSYPSPPVSEQLALTRHHRSTSEASALRAHLSAPSIDQFRKSPYRFRDIAARDLTGAVRTVHLLPTSRGDHCDIWKADWTGAFGTRKVAVQVIRLLKRISDDEQDRLTLIVHREAKALHQLRHPNVVRTRGLTRDQGPLPALVSTWLPRGDIMNYLHNCRPSAEKYTKVKLLTEVAAGLNYLHNFSSPILHGDLRGAHILMSENGSACISGFGMNPILQELELPPSDPVLAESTDASPRWAAIEVIRSGRRHITYESDVFSFARTVLEVMTGKDPYSYLLDDVEVVDTVLRGVHPRRPPVFGDEGLWPFLERCWMEDPTQRGSMALALLRMEEVLSYYEDAPVQEARPEPPNSAPP